jgi:hypothetical protein
MQQAYVEYTQSKAAATQELEVMNRQYYAVSLTRKDHTMPAKRVFPGMDRKNTVFKHALNKTSSDFKKLEIAHHVQLRCPNK